jgi:hypothetical protein
MGFVYWSRVDVYLLCCEETLQWYLNINKSSQNTFAMHVLTIVILN